MRYRDEYCKCIRDAESESRARRVTDGDAMVSGVREVGVVLVVDEETVR